MPGSISSEVSAAETETSTVIYEQEPFETFKDRVRGLCTTLWPYVPPENITIDRIHGGSSNRVTGITILDRSRETPEDKIVAEQYVLRVPRFEGERIEPELATLRFVQENAPTIPVPEVTAFDLTCDNPLNEVYNVQLKIAGVRLVDVYRELSQAEKLSVVGQLAQAVLDMHKVHSSLPGLLDAGKFVLDPENGKLVPEVRIVDFITKTTEDTHRDGDSLAKHKSIYKLLTDQFDGWQEYGLRWNRGQSEIELMDRFRTVAWQMEQLGLLKGDHYVLSHPDFDTQNILVSKEDGSGWKISGILDWEGTVLAPYAVACRPPTWIWSDWSNDDEEEAVLCELPSDPDRQARKKLFDTLMGTPYTEYAYSTHYRLVRRLFGFASNGVNASHEARDAEAFFDEWKEFYKEVGGGPVRKIYGRAFGLLTQFRGSFLRLFR